MRPSKAGEIHRDVVVVLDRTAELSVVRSQLVSDAPRRLDYDLADPIGAGTSAGLRGRFINQTTDAAWRSANRNTKAVPTAIEWVDGAHFGVLRLDVPFVKRAAARVIEEKDLVQRAWDRVSGRRRAAASMIAELRKIEHTRL